MTGTHPVTGNTDVSWKPVMYLRADFSFQLTSALLPRQCKKYHVLLTFIVIYSQAILASSQAKIFTQKLNTGKLKLPTVYI